MANSDHWIDNTTSHSPAREFERETGIQGIAHTYRLPMGETPESFELLRVSSIFRLARTDPETAFQQAEQLIDELKGLNPELRGINPRQILINDILEDRNRLSLPPGKPHEILIDEHPMEPRPPVNYEDDAAVQSFVDENKLKYILPMMAHFLRGVASEFSPGDILFHQQNACVGLQNSVYNISQHEMSADDPRFMYRIRLDRINDVVGQSIPFLASPETLTHIEGQLGLPDLRTQVPESVLQQLEELHTHEPWEQLKKWGVTGR